jgi:hypothetical protein
LRTPLWNLSTMILPRRRNRRYAYSSCTTVSFYSAKDFYMHHTEFMCGKLSPNEIR